MIAVCLFVVVLLWLKCRKLKKQIKNLMARLAKAPPPAHSPAIEQPQDVFPEEPDAGYEAQVDEQLGRTWDYHQEQNPPQDIALDLDPDVPSQRRTAALRYAFLVAEKEAVAADPHQVNWALLEARYQQLLDFHNDYPAASPLEAASTLQEEVEQLHAELSQAKKRIDNLERFKTLYFELEEAWGQCRSQADVHYEELRTFAETSQEGKTLERLLDNYQQSYSEVNNLIQQGGPAAADSPAEPTSQLKEIQRLRSVAADQHRIIQQLQGKLSSTSSSEEKTILVNQLQGALQKQARFLQESETCVRLMEDELANANRQIEQLRERAAEASELKMSIRELRGTTETKTQIADSLKAQNRKLMLRLKKALKEASTADDSEAVALRAELSALQTKHVELEEKFLNLKMKE